MQEFQVFRSALVERRDAIASAIDALDAAARLGAFGPMSAPATSNGKSAEKGNKQTNKQTKQSASQRAARSLPDGPSGTRELQRTSRALKEQALLNVLKAHGPVMKPGDLARRLQYASTTAMGYYLQPLVKAKRVVLHGHGGGRLIGLPGSKPLAKEAP